MHPAQPVPVRLESESLDDGKGASKGKQAGTKGSQGSTKEAEASLCGHLWVLVCSAGTAEGERHGAWEGKRGV